MLLTQLKRLCALVVATVALATAASMAPASAQEGNSEAEVAPMDLAPPCVNVSLREEFLTKYEDVWNLCGRTLRVKVIVAWGPDSACHTLGDNGRFTHTHGIAGRFDRLDLC